MEGRKRHDESLGKMHKLRNMFYERTSPLKSLTKYELLSLWHGKELKKVLKWSLEKTNKQWNEIRIAKKLCEEDEIIIVVCKMLRKGTELDDSMVESPIGKRILTNKSHVYFRCSDLESAREIKNKYLTIGEGFEKTGKHIHSVVKEELKQKPILKVLNEKERRC